MKWDKPARIIRLTERHCPTHHVGHPARTLAFLAHGLHSADPGLEHHAGLTCVIAIDIGRPVRSITPDLNPVKCD